MAETDRKRKQYIFLGVGLAAFIGLSFLTLSILNPVTEAGFAQSASASSTGFDKTIIKDRTSAAGPEASWIKTGEQKINNLAAQVKSLQASLEAQTIKRQQHEAELQDLRAAYDDQLQQQILKIQELSAVPVAVAKTPQPLQGSEFISGSGVKAVPARMGSDVGIVRQSSFGQSFSLAAIQEENVEGSATHNSLENYVPAGSYAPAVVLSGADAASNVRGRENPRPVLFRITGPAVTAGKRRVNIRGCVVSGSAIGDLSSERVEVRLVSITCEKPNNRVVEASISGYMVGAGKAGVRGTVVSREGKLITNAALAGTLTGLASAAKPAFDLEDLTPGKIAKRAAGGAASGGIESAASILAEHYIDRAAQYQPVITLNGGTAVELVFLEGIDLK